MDPSQNPHVFHATTILSVRRNGRVAVAGDGQVTLGHTVMKGTARKVRRLGRDGQVLAGFAGATGYDSKVWEQVKYYYQVDAWLPKNMVIVSQKAFDKLDKPTQEVVLKAAAAAEKRGWKISAEKTIWYTEQLAKNGMKVEKPSEQLKSDLKKVGLTMIADWTTQTGAEGQAVIDAFRK